MLDILEHFRQNWGYRLLAVVLSLITWMYVTGEQNPMGETVLRVPLETQNLSEDLVVAESPAGIQVRLEGRKMVVNSLLPREVHAYVDMQHAQTGDNFLPVQVEVPEGISIIDIKPAEAKIKVERIEQAQFPVQVSLTGAPASGFRVLEPVIKPSEVVISGPAGVLKGIGRVYVEAGIDQASGNYMAYLPVKLTNREGQTSQQWLDINPPAIEVFIPVIQDLPAKTVAIRPQLAGEPAEGYAIERVILQPEVVEVFAPYSQLADLDYINTAPINIAGAKKQVVRETTLEIPPGVQISIFPRVRVIIEIKEAAGNTE